MSARVIWIPLITLFVVLSSPIGEVRLTIDTLGTEAQKTSETILLGTRLAYKHSVVPGGIYSSSEFRRSRYQSAELTEHYKDFGNSVWEARLRRRTLMFVSYRMGKTIYWTKRPVRIPKNEPVLSDGKLFLRQRCGNRLSIKPMQPTSSSEPTEETINSVEEPPVDAPIMANGLERASLDIKLAPDLLLPTIGLPSQSLPDRDLGLLEFEPPARSHENQGLKADLSDFAPGEPLFRTPPFIGSLAGSDSSSRHRTTPQPLAHIVTPEPAYYPPVGFLILSAILLRSGNALQRRTSNV